VSEARKRIARAYGAELIFSDPLEGSDGAIRQVRELVAAEPGRWFYPDQYGNPENPRAHELGTAVEIAEALEGKVAAFVAGIGTSGTVMGASRGLRALAPGVRCFAVEPAEPLHGLEGLKHMSSSIVPPIWREAELDGKISVPTAEGWAMAERLGREEGLRVGHSAGAAVAGALGVARRMSAAGEAGNVVTILPDRADRYFEPPRWQRRIAW
jgi:cysteine synthase B